MTKQTKNATKNQTTIPHSTMTETPQHPVEMKDEASQLEAKIIPLFEEVTQNFAPAVPNEIMLSEQEEYRLASFWHNRIKEAQKVYEPYYQMIKKARQFYKTGSNLDTTGLLQSALSESGFNIFWSSIETQKPFLYFKNLCIGIQKGTVINAFKVEYLMWRNKIMLLIINSVKFFFKGFDMFF